jgi:integrase
MQTKSKRRRRPKRFEINSGKFLTDSEFESFLLVLKRCIKIERSRRDACMLYVKLVTGGRAREILSIRAGHFDPKSGTILVPGLKGSSAREIPLPTDLSRAMTLLIQNLDPQARVFKMTYARMRVIWVFYRPAPKKLHSLRHTFAMRLYLRTKDIRLVQLALGHRSLLNTMVYVDYVYRTNELKRLLSTENEGDS